MFLTYFRQKINKYALQLFGLQSLIIMSLLSFIYLQSVEHIQQKEDLAGLVYQHQEECKLCLESSTENIQYAMEQQAWQLNLGHEFVDCASEIRKYTKEVIEGIDKTIASKSITNKDLEEKNLIIKHQAQIVKSLEKLNKQPNGHLLFDQYDWNIVDTLYSHLVSEDKQTLWKQYQDLNTENSYRAYTTELKSDLRVIEKNLVLHLFAKMPSLSCGFAQYNVMVLAPTHIQQGDSATANIFLAEKIPVQGILIVEEDTLSMGKIDLEEYQIPTNKRGKQTLEGKLISKDAYGKTKTYPFIHEYTVLP